MSVTTYIYRSNRKEGFYFYLREKDDFDVIPQELLKAFGTPEFSMEIELYPERAMAREDAATVIKNLEERGFHVQLPPEKIPDLI